MNGTAQFWLANFGQLPTVTTQASVSRPAHRQNLLGAGSDQEAVQLYLRARRFTPARAQVFLTELG